MQNGIFASRANILAGRRAFSHFCLCEVFSMRRRGFVISGVVVCAVVAMHASGCGGSGDGSIFQPNGDDGGVGDGTTGDDGGDMDGSCFGQSCGDGGGGDGGGGDVGPPCVNLQCQVHSCGGDAGLTTTISGKILDPAGKNPLYNIVVYVPNAPVKPLPAGASCECESLFTGSPMAAAVTDATGSFTITNVPDGANIPLVIQVGKWRRQVTIANVLPCQDNAQPSGSLRLPKNTTEGDIPKMAISTGGADTLECLLSRIGLDKTEYTGGPGGTGRIHIFQGSGGPNTSPAAPASPTALWPNQAELMKYDIVLLSCEGSETTNPNRQALHDYASAGGRVFASHFHYSWFNSGPYASENLATWIAGTQAIGNINGDIITVLPNNQPFPKGIALKQWLGTTVNALTNGVLPIQAARHNATVAAANTPSQSWIIQQGAPTVTEYFSFNTPTNAPITDAGTPAYCGRVVYSDLHVGAASGDNPAQPVPAECAAANLSPQEKALEFMLFDLSACVTIDSQPPKPPPVPPPPPPK